MRGPSEREPDFQRLREKIIGLGERSYRKSYYPKLRQQMGVLQRFRALLNQSRDAIFLMELPSGRLVDATESAGRLLLYSRGDLLQLSFRDLTGPLPREIRELFQRQEPPGVLEEATLETLLLKSTGEEIPVEITFKTVSFGENLYAVGAARDITERKLAAERTETLLGQLRTIFDHIPLGIAYLDAEFRFISANRFFCELVALREEELIGKPCYETVGEYIHDESREGLARVCSFCKKEACLELKQPTVIERPLKERIIRVQTIPELDGRRSITRFLEIVEDITSRRRLEDSLREGERRFREMIDSLPQLVWTATGDGSCDYLSRQWNEYTGRAATEQLGDNWLQAVHPEDRPRTREAWSRFLRGESGYDLEYRLRRADGRYRWFKTRGVPIHDEEGRTIKIFGSCTDIDDKIRAEESLRELGAALQHTNRELEQFAHIVSHDLREPLRTIAGFLGLLRKRYQGRLDAEADEFIHYAVDGANRLDRMIRNLLDYSRTERQEISFQPIPLEEVLLTVKKNLQLLIAEAGARLTHDPLPVVRGDAAQLSRLLQNLITNGLTYRGARRPEIHLGAVPRGGQWQISVRDNGIGIPPEHLDRIFRIFQRLHTQKQYPGTGIGLAICKKIVERHGGRIWVESEPGQGSTFYFSLPRGEEAERFQGP